VQKRLMRETQCLASQARYYLLEGTPEEPSYGIQVELDGEEAAVWDLSPSREKVQELLASLIRGGVTPVALRDIVDDWLLE